MLHAAADPRVRALVTWAAISTVERWDGPQRDAWRAAGVQTVKNARTGQILPQYPDVLDDIERNAEALDIEAAAARVAVPWLIVHGSRGRGRGAAGRRATRRGGAQRLGAASCAVEGAGHTFGAAHPWQGATPELERVVDATLSFFAAELR